ncbi:unnamed protein product [Parascedosporium putredinis]|uniref:GYF domain-containing protein n=1 Tax=Parascedosporium putredinis TaxID=1442378 RepID=A0A9P1M8S1_9PEZI|nr:unnamed protein product [Parascedosporium putredinis]CAI7990472.1 unnamed protein product [Parascedosporium putredinis]
MDHKRATVRPRRAGEAFARTHHLDNDDNDDPTTSAANKKVKFDDAFLDADVIGKSSASTTKRGAVNIDGFDSDSDDVDEFNARAQQRRKKNVDINEAFAQYDPNDDGTTKPAKSSKEDEDEDEDEDDVNMFADSDDDDTNNKKRKGAGDDDPEFYARPRSTSGGAIHIDGDESDDDEDEEVVMKEDDEAWKDDVIDEEVGAGGRKKHAPKIEAFNLREELEEGRFDQNQNYVRNAVDPDAVHDRWLDGVSKKQMKLAAVARERREAEAEKQRMEEDSLLTSDLLGTLIKNLERGETALEALARLGRRQKREKKVPKWKLKKQSTMDTDEAPAQDPEQELISSSISAITDAADKLFSRDHAEIYDEERELLVRLYKRETGQDWVDPPAQPEDGFASQPGPTAPKLWEYRWVDGRGDGSRQGPFDGPTMKAWQDAGYFGDGVEFCPAGDEGNWSRIANFV